VWTQGIVHCDIKGGNILVTEGGIIKLADFNCSKKLTHIAGGGSNPLRSLLGTPQFMAPEVLCLAASHCIALQRTSTHCNAL